MNEGLEAMTNLFSDPKAMTDMAAQLVEGLDPAMRDKVDRLASGDENVLTE